MFTDLSAQDGQPALNPWRLALVSVMQFAENLSDRQAAEAVRARIDWKYALSMELTDTGFHYSVLSGVSGQRRGERRRAQTELPGVTVPSLKRSTTSSKTFLRLSIPATAARSISWSILSLA